MKKLLCAILSACFAVSLAVCPAAAQAEKIPADASLRGEQCSVGAVRWDAWYGADIEETPGVYAEVMRSLGPSKYHFRAPFYAEVTAEGGIAIPSYTQEIFDTEMQYAMDAGIDYFAYVWYSVGGLRKARDLHLTSQYKNDVKMCAIIDSNGMGNYAVKKEIVELMKEPFWMTVQGGRPLLYFFGNTQQSTVISSDIEMFRTLCEKAEVPYPYVVYMQNDTDTALAAGISADAVSRYSMGDNGGTSFKSLTKKAQSIWEEARGFQVVPTLATGWDCRTRAEHPVSWCENSMDSWVQTAKAEEIATHTKYALDWMSKDANKKCTAANTVIYYAWNEFDEGGWLCPTIAVDENGNQLYNEDGTKKIDTSRVDAIKDVISAYKSSTGAPAGTDNATAAPGSTTAPGENKTDNGTSGSKTLTIVLICVGAIVLAGGAAVITVKTKKKK